MSVVIVRQIESSNNLLEVRNERIGKMFLHCPQLRLNALFELRVPIKKIPGPFIDNLFGPSYPKNAGLVESQQNIPLPK